MLFNNLRIAIRQLIKQKFYSLINVIGLALSIACCILITLYIRHELSYDQYNKNADSIYRLTLDINMTQVTVKGTAIAPPVAQALMEEFPEVKNTARLNPFFFNAGTNLVQFEGRDESVFQENFVYIDHSFTEIFDFDRIAGNPSNWLLEPFQVIITEKIAKQFYPKIDPIGETLVLNDDPQGQTYTITGVVGDIPSNSHFNFDYFMSVETLDDNDADQRLFNNYYTYVQLQEGTKPDDLEQRMSDFSVKYFGPQFREQLNIDLAEIKSKGSKYDLMLQPLSDIHLSSEGFAPQLQANGDIRYIRIFSAIGVFLLLIALFNFINLSTARSANRAREVGVRKVLGSLRQQLIGQFLTESVLITFAAFAIGLSLAIVALPYFNQLSGKNLYFPYEEWWFVPSMLASVGIIGFLAGAYPSFYLSQFRPIKVLKGHLSLGAKSSWLRKTLVVLQFSISVMLIIGTLTVFTQMKFMQNSKLGFEKDQLIRIEDTYTLNGKLNAFKTALKNLPEVKNVSISGYLPLDGGIRNSLSCFIDEKDNPDEQVPMQTWSVDHDYINTMGMSLKQGRDFSSNRPGDSLAVILNEAAVQKLGLKEPLGKHLKSPFLDDIYTIIGVVENFNYENLRAEVEGLGLFLGRNTATTIVRAETDQLANLIPKIEQVWKGFAAGQALRHSFLDERFDQMYQLESRASVLLNIFTMMAILIACLGLLGLATFTAEQRLKEIGIRKILGASVSGIIGLLSKDFLKLVVLAIIIAFPAAFYFMDGWLKNFAHRADLPWWAFILAAILALGFAFLTVGIQSARAALANPVESLRAD